MRRLGLGLTAWLCGALPALAQSDSGAELFHSGGAGTARLAGGQVVVPAARFPCANCHGASGMGRAEGATRLPPVTWAALTDPTRVGGAHDPTSFARLLREGLRPDGTEILSLMPRYDLTDGEIRDLVAFLQGLEAKALQGIFPRELSLPIPSDPAFAQGLIAAMDALNDRGGAYGRRITLVEDEAQAVAGRTLFEMIDGAVRDAEHDALVGRLHADGVMRVAAPGATPDLLSRLERAGVSLDPGAEVILLSQDVAVSVQGKDVYLSHAILRHAGARTLDGARALTVALPQDARVSEMVAARRPGNEIDGFVAGLALAEGIVRSGRRLTGEELIEETLRAAAALPIELVATTRP